MIIGIAGKARSGKGTIANHLLRRYGFREEKFSAPLYGVLKSVYGLSDELIYDESRREEPLRDWPGWTVRSLLQMIGTKLREMDELVLVKSMELRLCKNPGNWVISDIRMPNERDMLKTKYRQECSIFKVFRGTASSIGIAGHETEKHDIVADVVFSNDGTVEDLLKRVDSTMQDDLKLSPVADLNYLFQLQETECHGSITTA
jgi:hypothetical protein